MAQMTLTLCTNRTPIVRAFHSGLQKGSLVQPSPFRLQNKCFYKNLKKHFKNQRFHKLRIQISSSTPSPSVEPYHHWGGSQYLGDEALKCPELHKGFPPQITCRSIQMMHPYFSTEQNKAYFRQAQGWQFFSSLLQIKPIRMGPHFWPGPPNEAVILKGRHRQVKRLRRWFWAEENTCSTTKKQDHQTRHMRKRM